MSDKSRPKGLGRGLNALFEDDEELVNALTPVEDVADSVAKSRDLGPKNFLGVEQLSPGTSQPRLDFDPEALDALASSIKLHGVLQPLLVRPRIDTLTGEPSNDEFEIIAGERRWRAAQLAQLHEVPVIIRDLEHEQAMQIALIENLQREDLNPVEEALAYQRLIQEHDYTQAKLAEVLGKSRSHIANMTRMLGLPEVILESVREGLLSPGHARCLIPVENPEEMADHIIKEGLSVRATEKWVQKETKPTSEQDNVHDDLSKSLKRINKLVENDPKKDPDLLALENELSTHLGMNVDVLMRKNSNAEGTLSIDFKSLDQLDKLLRLLNDLKTEQHLRNFEENHELPSGDVAIDDVDLSTLNEADLALSLEDEIRNLITHVGEDDTLLKQAESADDDEFSSDKNISRRLLD